MYNTVAALGVRNTQFSGDLGEFALYLWTKIKPLNTLKKYQIIFIIRNAHYAQPTAKATQLFAENIGLWQ